MKTRLISAPSLVVTCCIAGASTIVQADHDDAAAANNPATCSLYLAPSTSQPDDDDSYGGDPHSMGIFAGTDLPPGSRVGHTDLVIPIVDVTAHVSRFNRRKRDELRDRDGLDPATHHHSLDWHMSDMVWEPRYFGNVVGEGVDTKAAAPGLGTLVRGNVGMANIVHSRVTYDASGLHRKKDPSVGSFSYYHDLETITTKPVKAGQELYENFGMHYYSDREGAQGSGSSGIPPYSDPAAQDFFHKYQNVMEDHGSLLSANQGGVMDSLWAVLQDSPLQPSLQKILPKVWERDTVDELADSVVIGGHSPTWLHQNGRCLDNIRPGPSMIPQAGRGAFATRDLSSGSIIGPAPVVHMPDRSLLDVVEPNYSKHEEEHDGEEGGIMSDTTVTTKQLLVNYCFGHNKSTVLLCNVGAGTSYINHASPSSSGVEPNAKLQWSEHETLHNATWLQRSPDDLDADHSVGLMLEYVALRDIQEGEEILIDYGLEWEQAYNHHVESWKALPGSEDYVDAGVYNAEFGDSDEGAVFFRTVKEQLTDPYPDTIDTSCYYKYVPGADEETDDPSQVRMVTRRWMNGMDGQGTNLRPCRILMRGGGGEGGAGEEEYTVRILNSQETHHELLIPDEERLIVTNVPRHAVTFTNQMYSTDMHLPNAFRHEIMLSDELFPDAWKNVL